MLQVALMDKQYRNLTEQFTEDIFNNAADKTNDAYKQQNEDQKLILGMVAKVLLSYTIVDSILSLSGNDKKVLVNKFNVAFTGIVKGQFSNEKDLIDNILATSVKDKYYTDAYTTKLGMNFNLQKITDTEIKKIVNDKIDGELWSDRLWSNKKDLENKLQKTVSDFLKGNINVNQIEEEVKKKFNQNAYNTHRLVQSEVTRCQSEANDVFAENHDVEYQLYSATLDTRTSNFCREHDDKTYEIDDPNKPIPGVNTHPLCRSCLINLPSKDWKPQLRRDQENNKIIDWTNYQDWYDKNVANNPKALVAEKKIKNKASDKKLYEKYKEVLIGDVPKSFDKFQELKYNDVNGWNDLKGLYNYIYKNPESNKLYYNINKNIKQLRNEGLVRIKGVAVKPISSDIKELNDHTLQRMDERNITKEDIQSFINNSIVTFKQRKGTQYAYYSEKGFAAISTDGVVVSTGWLDKKGELIVKEAKKNL